MALPTMSASPKFLRLCHVAKRLGVSRPTMRGMLEQLWEAAHAQASPVFRDALYVEAACEWDGESGALCGVLVAEGWVEVCEAGLMIHDYWDHAPRWVKEQARKRESRAAKKAQNSGNITESTARIGAHEVSPPARICAQTADAGAENGKNCAPDAPVSSCAQSVALRCVALHEHDTHNTPQDVEESAPEWKEPVHKVEPEIAEALKGLAAYLMGENMRKSLHYRPSSLNLVSWPYELNDLMVERGMALQQLHAVLKWTQEHEFWRAPIQTPAALAKNLDTILAQMGRMNGDVAGPAKRLSQGHVDKFPEQTSSQTAVM